MSALPFDIPDDVPVLIAGPTASGKSGLALKIAEARSRPIINADALQVYDGWRILTARPDREAEARACHHLYGHIRHTDDYSVGAWLRDVGTLLDTQDRPPVIVGGTGLYFRALTEGLAEIPGAGADIRAEADMLRSDGGVAAMLAGLDPVTLARIDSRNPVRVQRAWEVQRATGRGLAAWQDDTPPPLLRLDQSFPIIMDAGKDWLNARIDRRLDLMMARGALEEARAMLADWDPARLSSRAISTAELIAHLQGKHSLDTAIERAKLASRQYAKRQRSWFRSRMQGWRPLRRG